jgi:hypothetical protein
VSRDTRDPARMLDELRVRGFTGWLPLSLATTCHSVRFDDVSARDSVLTFGRAVLCLERPARWATGAVAAVAMGRWGATIRGGHATGEM